MTKALTPTEIQKGKYKALGNLNNYSNYNF